MKNSKLLNIIAIFSLYFIGSGISAISPVMAKIAHEFSGFDYVLIATIPPLMMVPGIFISGIAAGRIVKYRTLALISCILYLVGGTLPVFVSDFWVIVFGRAILGFGIGILAPLGNSLVVGCIKTDKQTRYLGYGAVALNAGGVLLQLYAGYIAEVSWHLSFSCYFLAVFPLLCLAFLPEPQEKDDMKLKGFNVKYISAETWKIAFMLLLMNVLYFPIIMNISLVLTLKSLGDSSVAADVMMIYTIVGCIGGLLFGKVFKMIERKCICLGFFLCSAGGAILLEGNSLPVMYIAAAVLGFGYTVLTTGYFTIVGMRAGSGLTAISTSIAMIFMNIGAFLVTYWMRILNKLFGESILHAIAAEVIVYLVIAFLLLFKHCGGRR